MREIHRISGVYPNLAGEFGSIQSFPDDLMKIFGYSDQNGDPLVKYWFEPHGRYLGPGVGGQAQGWFDASSGNVFNRAGAGALSQTAGINNKPTIGGLGFSLVPASGSAPVPAEALSAFFVVKNTSSSTSNRYLLGDTSGATVNSISTYLTPTGFSTYLGRGNNGAPVRHEAADYLDQSPKLLAVTFSSRKGVTLRRNGVQVLSAPTRTDVNPTGKDLILFGSPGTAGRWSGDIGHCFVLPGMDASEPGYGSVLADIEGFLLEHYGLSRGA